MISIPMFLYFLTFEHLICSLQCSLTTAGPLPGVFYVQLRTLVCSTGFSRVTHRNYPLIRVGRPLEGGFITAAWGRQCQFGVPQPESPLLALLLLPQPSSPSSLPPTWVSFFPRFGQFHKHDGMWRWCLLPNFLALEPAVSKFNLSRMTLGSGLSTGTCPLSLVHM